jgi:hypothetical protein
VIMHEWEAKLQTQLLFFPCSPALQVRSPTERTLQRHLQGQSSVVEFRDYRPYLLLGEPVEVETQITVNFTLRSF